jgi:hypothetical protein
MKITSADSANGETHGRKKFTQTRDKTFTSTNLPYGDDIQMTNTDNNEIVLFHNINGMKDTTNWYQILTTMKELKVDIFGFVEINQSLSRGYSTEWKDTIRKIFTFGHSIHSESNVQLQSSYKPGGTLTTTTAKWQSRISEQGQDKRGLGRWSYQKVSSKKASLIIITAYRPCASQGPSTAWMQQWVLLREAGQKSPDPIKQFYNDLHEQLSEWKQQGSEILLMTQMSTSARSPAV